MKCNYEHHETNGKELGNCPKHPNEELKCGAFVCPVCPKCSPFEFGKCGRCGTIRWACCC